MPDSLDVTAVAEETQLGITTIADLTDGKGFDVASEALFRQFAKASVAIFAEGKVRLNSTGKALGEELGVSLFAFRATRNQQVNCACETEGANLLVTPVTNSTLRSNNEDFVEKSEDIEGEQNNKLEHCPNNLEQSIDSVVHFELNLAEEHIGRKVELCDGLPEVVDNHRGFLVNKGPRSLDGGVGPTQ